MRGAQVTIARLIGLTKPCLAGSHTAPHHSGSAPPTPGEGRATGISASLHCFLVTQPLMGLETS